jgi:hypothetical protein
MFIRRPWGIAVCCEMVNFQSVNWLSEDKFPYNMDRVLINVKEQKEREDLLNLDFYMFHTFTEWALYSLNESAKLYLTD